jgi:hypothetical protein
METSPENFESLRKLLKLKRYEQPPPRFFNEFSGHVIARIRSEGMRPPRWWERFGIDLRPVVAVGAGAVACVTMFFTMAATPEGEAAANPYAASATIATAQPATDTSTNPVINAAGTMMLDPWRARVSPASFRQ